MFLQVLSEFHRITNVNLQATFFAELDRLSNQLLGLFRRKAARTAKISQALRTLLGDFDALVTLLILMTHFSPLLLFTLTHIFSVPRLSVIW